TWNDTYQKQLAAQAVVIAEQQKQQAALALAAQQARAEAERQAAGRIAAENLALQRPRRAAYVQLINQGNLALQQNNFNGTIQVFQSAVNIKKGGDGDRLLALARAKADEEARRRVAEDRAARERALREKREQELLLVRKRLDEQTKTREAEL